jgi:hypothetical protein
MPPPAATAGLRYPTRTCLLGELAALASYEAPRYSSRRGESNAAALHPQRALTQATPRVSASLLAPSCPQGRKEVAVFAYLEATVWTLVMGLAVALGIVVARF